MINGEQIKADVVGRWPGIFNNLGIDVGDGRHTKCPACGGKDRFRCDDKEGKGTYYCSGCGAGDGWSLIQKVLGIDFSGALNSVAEIIGTVDKSPVLKEKTMTKEIMRKIFMGSKLVSSGDPVHRYLTNRGLTKIPEVLRYHPKMWDTETHENNKAMLAVFMLPDNIATTMHRTFIDADGNKLKIKDVKKVLPVLKKMNGGAIRLFPLDGRKILGIAEGIETAIAATQYFGVPVWAATSAGMMECFEPPKGLNELQIFGDNDFSYAGHKAAYTMAHRASVIYKIPTIRIHIPEEPGTDWNDVILRKK